MPSTPFSFAFVSNSAVVAEKVQAYAQEHGWPQEEVRLATMEEALPVARRLFAQGVDVILGGGGTGKLLRRHLNEPVVTISRSHMSILQALMEAREYTDNVAVTCYDAIPPWTELFSRLLHIRLQPIRFTNSRELTLGITQAIAQGAGCVVGGGVCVSIAQAHHCPGIVVCPDNEALERAFEEASNIAQARRRDREHAAWLQDVVLTDLQRRLKHSRQAGLRARFTLNDLLGESPSMQTLRVHAQRFAESDAVVYIHGESGTGKELLAHAIHNASPRRHAAFVAVNCGALPESLLESELFGYAEGAFTGARRGGKQGLFELAQDGTIFLDEIADISAAVQVRLLRVLESGEIFRLGGDRPVTVNARVVCSSWKDLVQEVREGRFRADLYYRLTLLRLEMPPLRERLQDMTLLVRHIMRRMGMIHKKMTPEAIELLCSYPWPGNVRELDALLRRYCLMSTSDTCQMPLLRELLLDMRQTQGILASPGRASEKREEQDLPANGSLRQRLRLMEKKIIRQELARQQYSKKSTARSLGISLNTLWRKMCDAD